MQDQASIWLAGRRVNRIEYGGWDGIGWHGMAWDGMGALPSSAERATGVGPGRDRTVQVHAVLPALSFTPPYTQRKPQRIHPDVW